MNQLKDGEVQLIITSPPYYQKRKYLNTNTLELGNEPSVEEYLENLSKHFDDCWRVLADDGVMYINLMDSYNKNNSLCNIPSRLFQSIIDRKGWLMRNQIIWAKKNFLPSSVKNSMSNSYEIFGFFTKQLKYKYHKPQLPTKKKGLQIQQSPNHIVVDEKYNYAHSAPYINDDDKKGMSDFWTDDDIIHSSVANQSHLKKYNNGEGHHPALMASTPIDILIESSSDEGDLVLDIFCGSSSVGQSCMKKNRRFVGYDTNLNYINLSNQILKDIISDE
jgi:DNA modification methylase